MGSWKLRIKGGKCSVLFLPFTIPSVSFISLLHAHTITMVEKRNISAANSASNSSRNSPAPQRQKMDSPKVENDKLASTQEKVAAAATPERLPALASDPMPDEVEVVEADDNTSVADSGFGTDNSYVATLQSNIEEGI